MINNKDIIKEHGKLIHFLIEKHPKIYEEYTGIKIKDLNININRELKKELELTGEYDYFIIKKEKK